jgi:hypothetical protein
MGIGMPAEENLVVQDIAPHPLSLCNEGHYRCLYFGTMVINSACFPPIKTKKQINTN